MKRTSWIKKSFSLLLTAAIALSADLYGGSAMKAHAADSNVLSGLIGSGVVASSADYNGFAPYTFAESGYSGQALTDGNTTATVPIVNLFSAWQQPVKSGVLYDLGGRYSLSSVAVYADSSTVTGVNVYIGDHAGNLATAANLAGTLAAGQLNAPFAIAPKSGRYVLFMLTDIASTNIAKVAEFRAFGSANTGTATAGPDNVARGIKPNVIKVTGTNGDLSQLTDVSVNESDKAALTDGRASTAPGSNAWQWDGKIWTGTNGLTYVLGFNLNAHDALSRFTFSTPAGTSPASWSVYLSDDPAQLLSGTPACTTPVGGNETFNYSCSLASSQTAQYVTFVVKSLTSQDTIFPSEIEIYGSASAVWGVSDGKSYKTNVTPMFGGATATLSRNNGAATAFASGTTLSNEGSYKLTVTENGTGKVTVVNFAIDKTAPVVSGVANGGTYTTAVAPTYSDTSAVSGELIADTNLPTSYARAYASGTTIAASGSYRLTATDAAGNATVVNFTINNPNGGAAALPYYRGVNLPTAGFAGWVLPGVEGSDYEWDKEADFQYFTGKGFNIIRVAPLWERLQPTLRGPLDQNYLNGLIRNIAWAKKYNARVIIDIHNYGRFHGNIIGEPGSGVTNADFNDLWVKISNVFKNDPGVYAYDLMNEPHDMGGANWKATSQAALTAIRNNGDHHTIMIAGDNWQGAGEWTTYNPTPWITDPDNNYIYEAHEYFDWNSSGVYEKSYDEELALNPNLAQIGAQRLKVFGDWCVQYGAKCYIGEYGAPKTDGRWLTVLDNFMKALDQYSMDGTYWAGGGRWGSYPLAIQPGGNYNIDAPQMSVLVNHISPSTAIGGVVNGAFYKTNVTPTFTGGTATLARNGGTPAAYSTGTQITQEGSYVLKLTSAQGQVVTVSFVIDKTAPAISGVSNGTTYTAAVTPTFTDATATTATLAKDGGAAAAYVSGSSIAVSGSYVLTVKDAAGNVSTVAFVLNLSSVPGNSVNVLNGLIGSGVVGSSADYRNFGLYAFTDSQYSGQALTDGSTTAAVPIANQFSGWSQPNIKSGVLYDLGARYDLSSVAVYAAGSTVTGVDVYVSDHEGDLAVTANLAGSLTAGQLNAAANISPKTGRYVLFMFSGTANGTASVTELKAFGTANTATASVGPDNKARGIKPSFVKVTGTNGSLSQLTDLSVADSIKTAMTDGLATTAPGSNAWQWDGKVWTGTNGLTYVIGFNLGQAYNVSRFTFSTPPGTEPANWSVYLSNDPANLLGGSPACSTPTGTSQTYNYSCSLPAAQSAQYVTFVVKAQSNQDAIFPSEIQVFGQ
ncbi:glycoside hydrolase family 5 protein [Cohnella sp. 56]|uniref:glycoside hydrolase family 5 protein n=1 Tax=Cohnella sp. 56 TaxID=3113722 RepID=UPI0030EAADCF